VIRPKQRPLPDIIQQSQETGIYVSAGYEPTIPASEQSADPHLRPRGYRDRQVTLCYGLRNKQYYQGTIDRLIKIGSYCGIEMCVGETKNWGNENLKTTVPSTDYGSSKATGECEIWQLLVSTITNGARRTCKIKTMILMARAKFRKKKKKKICHQQFDFNLTKKLLTCSIWGIHVYGAETCTLRKVAQRKLLKCDVGEGWRRSVGLIVWKMKKYCTSQSGKK
jgi:hypothetical protein